MDRGQLPMDVLADIVVRLPAESVCCIQCVSKALLDMVDHHSFVTRHTGLLVATNAVHQVPQLMFFTRSYVPYPGTTGEHYVAFQSIKFDGSTSALTRGNFAISVTPLDRFERAIYRVTFVFCNLIGFISNRSGFFLINPLKGEVLRLPSDNPQRPNSEVLGTYYGMGFDNITNTYKIVCVTGIYSTVPETWFTQILVLGTSSWRDISSVPPCALSTQRRVCAYGDTHWLTLCDLRTCHIISFDFKKEEFYCLPHPVLQSSNDHLNLFVHLHLLTLRGSLAMVDTSSSTGSTMNMDIWMLKDYDKKEWTRDYSINLEMPPNLHPKFGATDFTCDQWEHGIFFKNFRQIPTFFLDLRCLSICPVIFGSGDFTNLFSYTGSLISLKDYRNSVEAETGSGSLKSYGK